MAVPRVTLLIAMGLAGATAAQALGARPARAKSADTIEVGREFAISKCSPCHMLPAQASEQRSSTPGGPSFAEIAQGPRASPEALRGFLRSTHSTVAHPAAMPHLELTDEEIDAIAAYLSSLRQTR